MRPPDRTVADWIAEGLTTMAFYCAAIGCGHDGIVKLSDLPARMTRDRLMRQARCSECGHRGARVMRDMAAHYRRMRDESGFDPTPRPSKP